MKVSAVIIVKNAEKTIGATLESLKTFDEVVVCDNGSTDNTLAIANNFENVKLVKYNHTDGVPAKNPAVYYAKNDWILSIESNEVVSPQLLSALEKENLSDDTIYSFERSNYYKKQQVHFYGWGKEIVSRLYNRNIVKSGNKILQENTHGPMAIKKKHLKGALRYYQFHNNSGFVQKTDLNNSLTCSLIITTYNRPDALLKSLESVLHQEVPPNEIIVADDGSGDETREAIKEFAKHSFIPVKHLWQEDKGFRVARSRNIAIAKSDYDYIIAIDGDLILHKSFVRDHLACAKEKNYIQGSRVFLGKELTEQLLKNKNKKIQNVVFSANIKNRLKGFYIPIASKIYCIRRSRSHKGIRGCNFSLFKSDILKVNGFNEDFNTWGKEDSEFAERLFNAGVKRRDLKFKAIQYHLYHKEGNANSNNDALLQKTIKQKLKYCENGIHQHYRQ